jgi:golgin subfamily A member 4
LKGAHNKEDDGTGSDGFEMIDLKENLDPAKVEEVMAVPRSTTDHVSTAKTSLAEEDKTTAVKEQAPAGDSWHPESSLVNKQTKQLEELTRRIEQLESEKGKLAKDLTEAENKQSLHYSSLQEVERSLTIKIRSWLMQQSH